jgi:hypothetical protein
VLAVEEIREWHVGLHTVADVADQSLLPRQADDGGKEALGDAERHVHAFGLSPRGDDVAVVDDDAVQRAARFRRTDGSVERLASERRREVDRQVLGRRVLARHGEGDGGVEFGLVESRLVWRAFLPVMAFGEILGCLLRRCSRLLIPLRPRKGGEQGESNGGDSEAFHAPKTTTGRAPEGVRSFLSYRSRQSSPARDAETRRAEREQRQ